jgi:D-arabinose 1-dehydrogenase-like Zn-dependent alcohol dehydrogenase
MPGDVVAVLGVGGLGHLAIQFADKFGYKVVAIGRHQPPREAPIAEREPLKTAIEAGAPRLRPQADLPVTYT